MTQATHTEAIKQYFSRMGEIRGTGGATKETSFYSALENLLNHFGRELKPIVICNGQIRNQGAGNPDFGLYTKGQIQGGDPKAVLQATITSFEGDERPLVAVIRGLID